MTKLELAEQIKKFLNCSIVESDGKDADHRDYIINFDKINELGFSCELDLESGIKQSSEVLMYLKKTGEFDKFKSFYKIFNA